MSIFSKIGELIGGGVSNLVESVTGLLDEVITSEEEKLELKRKMDELLYNFQRDVLQHSQILFEAQRDVLVAEARGESWLQRSWRPITMLTFVGIIANNYIVAPYVAAFGGFVPTLDIPNGMWALLNVGIGGYIASRGVEKVFKIRNGNA